MDINLITPANIMFLLGLIGIAYTVFISIYGPQKKSEANDLLLDQRANFLSDEYSTKFKDIQAKFDELAKNNQNHLHTIEVRLETLTQTVSELDKSLVRVSTILEERLPKKYYARPRTDPQ